MAQQFSTEMQLQQHKNMAAILKMDSMRDVTFLIGEEQKEYTGNRIAMSSISEPLRIMLFGSMKESQPDTEVIIGDIEPEGFQSVLNWAHLEDPQIAVDNVVSVRSICRKYQISDLSVICDRNFRQYLNATTFCSLLVQSRNHKLDEYVQICIQSLNGSIGDQISHILWSNGFMKMNVESMIFLLQLENVCIAEERIWDAVLNWKNYQIKPNSDDEAGAQMKGEIDEEPPTKRRRFDNHNSGGLETRDLRAVVRHIRFGLMQHQYFVEKVQPTGCLDQEEIITISNYMGMKGKNPVFECGPFSTAPRRRGMDFRMRKFQYYGQVVYDVLNNGLEIKGKQGYCSAYLVYPTATESGGYSRGIHVWSLLAETVSCTTHQIGVMTQIMSNSPISSWPTSGSNVYINDGSSWGGSTQRMNRVHSDPFWIMEFRGYYHGRIEL